MYCIRNKADIVSMAHRGLSVYVIKRYNMLILRYLHFFSVCIFRCKKIAYIYYMLRELKIGAAVYISV